MRLISLALFAGLACGQVQLTPLFDLPGETSDAVLSPDGKTLAFEWWKPDYSFSVYTRPFSGGEVRLLAGKATDPRWSPDGKGIAVTRFYSHYDNHLVIHALADGIEQDLGNICGYAASGVWSPDAAVIAASVYKNEQTLECQPALFAVATGGRRLLASSGGEPSFSPDGRSLAYADGDNLMLLRLTASHQPSGTPVRLVHEPGAISEPLWTPDGKELLYAVWQHGTSRRRIAIASGSRPQSVSIGDLDLTLTQLLPDGAALATQIIQSSALWRADLRTTPPKLEKVPDQECSPGILGCSPDGLHRAIVTSHNGQIQIAITDAAGANGRVIVPSVPLPEPDDPGGPNLSGWSPDGKWIAFTVLPATANTDFRSFLYVVPSAGGSLRRLGKEAYALDMPVWSRDSRSLIASRSWEYPDHDGERALVRVDLADGKITPVGADGIWPQLSPDGRYLYFASGRRREPISQIPSSGGPIEVVIEGSFDFPGAAIGTKCLYLLRSSSVTRVDLATRQSTTVLSLPFAPRRFVLSADENFLYLARKGPGAALSAREQRPVRAATQAPFCGLLLRRPARHAQAPRRPGAWAKVKVRGLK